MTVLTLDSRQARTKRSGSQKARVMTEPWVASNLRTLCCDTPLQQYQNNNPAADFYCGRCYQEYELKSSKKPFGSTLSGGEYYTTIQRLQLPERPHYIFLQYDESFYNIVNIFCIPGWFFYPGMVKRRKKLGKHARRAGWTGAKYLMKKIPQKARVSIVVNGVFRPAADIARDWDSAYQQSLLRIRPPLSGWNAAVWECIQRLDKSGFTLQELYQFEDELRRRYPANNHVRKKIQQQLAQLRDKGYVYFLDPGNYVAISAEEEE